MYNILDKVQKFEDLKSLDYDELDNLSNDIRKFLIHNVSKTGGHLASNLGVVELTIGMYRVFDLNLDKVLWDVSHQCYVHKILTGRKEGFKSLRKFNGMSGFLKKCESKYDFFEAGHSSTSISAATGFARARDIKGEDHNVVAVIGDGALTGGMAFEALNDIGYRKSKMLIILNDNEMSISKNVGSMSNILNDLRVDPKYNRVKSRVKKSLGKLPYIGKTLTTGVETFKDALKQVVLPKMIFEDMGLHYFGPIDGHDIKHIEEILKDAKKIDGPVLVHVITKKGKGYKPAENRPNDYHGVGEFDIATGLAIKKKSENYSGAVGNALVDIAEKDRSVVAITAAMPKGTGLDKFSDKYPDRFFDVGIAEQHAVTMAGGLANEGLKPFFAVYSTFLQRAFDQVFHDVCLQNVPVVIGIDRAGLVGSDGETHQGIYDISFLSQIPNMTILSPKKISEVHKVISWAFENNGPTAIRYPRGGDYSEMNCIPDIESIQFGKWEEIKSGEKVAILANGKMVGRALKVYNECVKKGMEVKIINSIFIKPMDEAMLDQLCSENFTLLTIEDNILRGGFGEGIRNYLCEKNYRNKVVCFGFPDEFIRHGDVELLFDEYGMSIEAITNTVEEEFRR